ncbi:MAG: serine hydrolase domain-containing protein [Chloroflexota bacterium]
MPADRHGSILTWALIVALAGCAAAKASGPETAASASPPDASAASASAVEAAAAFPTALFAGLGQDPLSDEVAADLQEVLDGSANGDGLTAAVITPEGTWSGATGMATAARAMVPDDQLAIASITKTIVAAQVMQLAERGELRVDDLAADHLPPDLRFDTNEARIIDLLSMRSGIPQYFADGDELAEVLTTDPSHVWTPEEKLATVAAERGPVGQEWEYIGTNYLLLGLIIQQVAGRSVADVLRGGVLAGHEYERLIYQPDERPTEPMAMTVELGATADAFEKGGGYLPSLSMVTMFTTDGGMASDSMSLARWFKGLCAGEVVSPASLNEMTDFDRRPGYGLGIIDRSGEYWPRSGALGHKGSTTTVALCFQDPASVVVVLANAEHDVDTLAGSLVRAASH